MALQILFPFEGRCAGSGPTRLFFVETVGGHHYRCLHTPCIECRRARGRYDPTAGYGEMVTLIGGEIGIDDVAARLDR